MSSFNLALVDIGAGTSDIAITKNGSISGYAMVPIAGDEITEKMEKRMKLILNGNQVDLSAEIKNDDNLKVKLV